MQNVNVMTEITGKFDDVSNGFINIYKVLDDELHRSDVFIPFLNSMLKLQTSISFTGSCANTENEAVAIALDSVTEVGRHVEMMAKENLVAESLTNSMISDCRALCLMIEAYIEENKSKASV